MRGNEEEADAIEVAPVGWTWADGLAHVEVIGGTVRFVLYVREADGGEVQRRIAHKIVLPIEGVLAGLQKTLLALVRPVGAMARVVSNRMH